MNKHNNLKLVRNARQERERKIEQAAVAELGRLLVRVNKQQAQLRIKQK